MPVYKKVNKDFFKKWSPEMAYVLGFFAADGNMIKNKRGAHFFSIEINDGDLLKKIKKLIGSNHKISIRRKLKKQAKSQYRLQIGSKEIFDDLLRLGFNGRKTKNLKLPSMPDEMFFHFVRGYFDGDGNVWVGFIHKDRRTPYFTIQTVFTSGCGSFLKHFAKKLESCGIFGFVTCGKGYFRLTYSVLSSLKLAEFMYSGSVGKLFLQRKKKVFDKFLQQRMRL